MATTMTEVDKKKIMMMKNVIRLSNNNESVFEEFVTSILGDDLLEEIFVRLPHLASVYCCRMVCNRWRSVISGRFISIFKRHHRLRPETLPFTLLLRGGHGRIVHPTQLTNQPSMDFFSPDSQFMHGKLVKPSPDCTTYLNFMSNSSEAVIKSSFNDLLLVQFRDHRLLRVCNPCIRAWVNLRLHLEIDSSCLYGLVVDPKYSAEQVVKFCVVVFGFQREGSLALIFRSEKGRWDKEVPTFSLEEGLSLRGVPVGASNGVVYCAIRDSRLNYVMKAIMSFDPFNPERKHYSAIDLPNGFSRWQWMDGRRHSGIGIVRGNLRLWQFCAIDKADCFILRVWELNSDGYWVIVHDVRPRVEGLPFPINGLEVRALHPCDDYVVFLVATGCQNVWQYHIGRGSCDKICEFDKDWVFGHIYVLFHPALPTMFRRPIIR